MRTLAILASALTLLALPAVASTLDPAKVRADPIAQRTLEAIDGSHHLKSLGNLSDYVLTADTAKGQSCTLADKGNDIFMMEYSASKDGKTPSHSLLLTGENGRLRAVSMYSADSHLMSSEDAYQRLSSVSPAEPETTPTTSSPDSTLVPPAQGVPLASATSSKTLFFALNRNSHRVNLGTAVSLGNTIKHFGGKCSFSDTPGTGAAIVCLFPDVSDPHNLAANDLELDTSFDPSTCPNLYECYEVRDIKLNDHRITQEQYMQTFGGDHK